MIASGGSYYNIASGTILPAGYQQVEYIESSGTQYINTGINDYVKAVIDLQFNSSSTRQLVGYTANASNYFDKQADNYYGLGAGVSSQYLATTRRTIIFEKTEHPADVLPTI